jgi:hypothetical protein
MIRYCIIVMRLETRFPFLKRSSRSQSAPRPQTPAHTSSVAIDMINQEGGIRRNAGATVRISTSRPETNTISLQNTSFKPNVNLDRPPAYVYKDVDLPSYEKACMSNTNV